MNQVHRHSLSVAQKVVVLRLLMTLGIPWMIASCGQSTAHLSREDREKSYRELYSATEDNVERWAPLWDKQSWIVTLASEGASKSHRDGLRSLLLNDLTEFWSTSLPGPQLAEFRDLLGTGLSLDFSYSPGALRSISPAASNSSLNAAPQTIRGPSQWLARVTFPAAQGSWQHVIGAPILTDVLPADLTQKLAVAQLRALKATSRFEWVEPNLGADPMQANGSTPTDSEKSAPGGRPSEWFANENGPVEPSRNRIRQVFTRINWHLAQDTFKKIQDQNPDLQLGKAEIPVAVLDTGVDYQHPKLAQRMFKNPLEIEGNGVDDDNNGYVDDVYGIDATIPPGQVDTSFAPTGPADVGGPGAKCPSDGEQAPSGGTCGHGTHVAGIVAAQSGGLFAVGLCDACRVYSIRASKKCLYPDTTEKGGACVTPKSAPQGEQYIANGKIFDWDQIAGLNYILNFTDPNTGRLRIFIVNLSLGKYVYNRTMASVLTKLEESGVLVIAAAGNDNTETPMFPAAYGSVLSVCATSEDNGTTNYGRRGQYAKADFSNFGDWVGICAPGVDILSTFPGNRTQSETGTSMASPLVAGAAGYIWSILYNLGDPSQGQVENNFSIRGRLQRFADPTNLYSPDNVMNQFYGRAVNGVSNYLLGTGLLDVNRALLGKTETTDSSYVANERFTGASSQVTSGCIVSTIGRHHAHSLWKMSDILTTMPFVMLQFIGFVMWRRVRHKIRQIKET